MIKCTVCGSDKIAPIKYGFPTPKMIDRARNEEIALGGLQDHGYTHYCYACHETLPETVFPPID